MRKYYNNGINEKRFLENDLIPEGWYPGRLKSTITTKNCIWVNNGIKELFIQKDSIIPEGYQKGRIKEHLNPIKQSNSLKEKELHWYNNGFIEKTFSKNDIIPEDFSPGRLPVSDLTRQKVSKANTGRKHTEEEKQKIRTNQKTNNRKKANQTIIEKWGSLENYYHSLIEKGLETKHKRHTFNTSNIENKMFIALKEIYGEKNVLRNYKSLDYPFRCDFYIISENKYIELNAHWTHGGKPFNPNDDECIKQLNEWKEKAKISNYFKNAIETWTVRDVKKLETFKKNNLNYEILY